MPPDLQTIASTLRPNLRYQAAKAAAEAVDGMFSAFSMAVIDILLTAQAGAEVSGHMLEMGVYKGRSAAIFGPGLRAGERLVLVDICDQLDRAAIRPFADSVDFIVASTTDMREAMPNYRDRRRSFRFIHIDASHAYKATYNELEMADDLLGNGGIIAMDDFTNLDFSQNMAAIFRYLFAGSTHLTAFLVTNEKVYLCRKPDFEFYAGFVLNRLLSEMESRGIKDCVLARTDDNPDFKPFYARHAYVGEAGHYYGPGLYQRFLEKP